MVKLCSLTLAVSAPLCATHGAMNKPAPWLDPEGMWIFAGGANAAGCKEEPVQPDEGCVNEWYSNYTFIKGEPTIPPKSPLLTYQDACMSGQGTSSCCSSFCQDPANQAEGQPCEGCDWTRTHPWRAPGTAPVFSPCGFDGGNPEGCPVGNPGSDGCAGGGYGHGPDGRSLSGNNEPAVWSAGGVEEVSWAMAANHGGGYQYRLCPRPANHMDLTEECFQQTPLRFVGSTQWLQNGRHADTRTEIPALRIDNGTFPAGSQWTRNPIPACGTFSGGAFSKDCSGLGTQFPPPVADAFGFHLVPWNIIDKVHVPNLPAGDYVIGFRYDCEQTTQVWQQCGDVRIADGPSPAPPTDNCDNPACSSCCTGVCIDCKACVNDKNSTGCAACWASSDGAPPCNLRGTQCLGDDGLSCEACWSSEPLPAAFTVEAPPASAATQDQCRTDVPECASCCSGSCNSCRGYCETHKDGDCASCWTASDGAPPCNLRGTQCLADDGLSCELCWQPAPSPVPPPPSPPGPSPTTPITDSDPATLLV